MHLKFFCQHLNTSMQGPPYTSNMFFSASNLIKFILESDDLPELQFTGYLESLI